MRVVLIIIFACLTPVQFWAQEKFSDNLKVMLNYQYGFTLPEYKFVTNVVNDYIQAVDIAFMKERYGRDDYEQAYNYPENGISLFYTSLGNKDILGQGFAINYMFRVPIINRTKFKLFNRMGIGLGYLTKTHDLVDNQLNVAIGSRMNIHYNCRVGASYQPWDRLAINAGASFDHFSNGNTAEPNIGLNYLTFYSGLIYRIGDKIDPIVNDLEKPEKKIYGEVFYSMGGKHTRAFTSKYYFTSSVAVQFGYNLSRSFHIGAGLDLFYDSSIKTQLADLGEEYSPHQSFQTGLHLTQTIAYRKFRFTLQEGLYIGLVDPINRKPMYNRGILQYYVKDNWSIRIAMKSHLHILDYPEIGFGYKFL